MAVTREDVLKITALAKLKFDEAQLDAFTEQFQRIIAYFEKLGELDVAAVAPTSHVTPYSAAAEPAFREDEPRPSLPSEEALSNAPERWDGQFSVPRIIQEE